MAGGGMRQAGILAAAGIVALETMVERLGEDHARARRLADGLRGVPGLVLETGTPATNMVFVSLLPGIKSNAWEIREALKAHGVLVGATSERQLRLVTHYWIDDSAVNQTIRAFGAVLSS